VTKYTVPSNASSWLVLGRTESFLGVTTSLTDYSHGCLGYLAMFPDPALRVFMEIMREEDISKIAKVAKVPGELNPPPLLSRVYRFADLVGYCY
jgi:hypothetical protein